MTIRKGIRYERCTCELANSSMICPKHGAMAPKRKERLSIEEKDRKRREHALMLQGCTRKEARRIMERHERAIKQLKVRREAISNEEEKTENWVKFYQTQG